jgi:AraC-like ligand binding domain
MELFRASVSQLTFRPHAHEQFFIALTESGHATAAYRRVKHAIGPGDIIVLNPEEGHAGGATPGGFWTYRALYAPTELMRQVNADFPPGVHAVPRFTIDVVNDPQVVARRTRDSAPTSNSHPKRSR